MDADYYDNHDNAEDDGSANNGSIQFKADKLTIIIQCLCPFSTAV